MGDVGLWASVPASTNAAAATAAARQPSGELDRNAFLMLLVTQMQHQDPLNPMDDRDFLAQMAQFSALEQQQHMTRSMERQQAYSLIGNDVYAHFFDENAGEFVEVFGPVLTVTHNGANTLLGVLTDVPVTDDDGEVVRDANGDIVTISRTVDVPLERITWVMGDSMSSQLQGILDGVANARDIGLIGRYVQAIVTEEGQAAGFVEGVVEFVRFSNGQAILMVNGQEIFADEVFSVSDRPLVLGREISGVFIREGGGGIEELAGLIQGISISGGRAFVDIVGGGRIPLNRIDELVEGLQFVGRGVTHPTLTGMRGVIDRVSIRNGAVYLHIGNQSEELREFLSTGGRQVPISEVAPPDEEENPDENPEEEDE
ncbi:MAG: hypothetical protein FWG65_11725 [Turicibacter sp.]|nr:hypothetical protein [Turicibacter sp.]